MRHSRRGLWIALIAAGAALALLAVLISSSLHPAGLKARLIAEVERATGRTMTISGEVGVSLALVPTITIQDVTLSNPIGSNPIGSNPIGSNPPGSNPIGAQAAAFSRPEMLKVARVEISVALIPLLEHQLQVSHVSLIRPDILLETDKAGHRNWVFARDPAPAADDAAKRDTGEPRPAGAAANPFAVSLEDIQVEDGRIGWIDAAAEKRLAAEVPHLTVTAPIGGGMQATGLAICEGHRIALTARTGAIEREPDAWPVALRLESDGATLMAEGHLVRPGEGRGYAFTVDADVPNPKAFAASFPRLSLADVTGLKARAEVKAGQGLSPIVSAMTVTVNSIDLDALAKGLRLGNVSLKARGDEQIRLTAGVTAPGLEAGVSGTVDAPGLASGGVLGPVAVDLDWNAAGARGNVKGTIRSPARLSGYTLDVSADVPRPSDLWDRAPSSLKSLIAHVRLTDGPERVIFQATSSAGDLAGEVAVIRETRPSVTGTITSRRLDLDALRLSPAAEVPARASGGSAPPGQSQAAPLIGDGTLPFDRLRAADAEVTVRLGQARLEGTDLHDVAATLSAKDGLLRLDIAARSDQPINATLVADATKAPPAVHLTMRAPGLPLRLLLAGLDLPQAATGTAEVQADLAGAGDTPKQIAGSLNGAASIAVEGGQLDARMVNTWLAALKPLHIDGGDTTDLRCLAIRADATSGVVTIQPAAMNTAALILEGSGDVDLGQETMALRLRPRTKLGGTGIALPLRVSGPLRSPSAKVDISAGGGGGALAGLLLGGKDIMGAAGGGDPCPAALARAREPLTAGARP